MSQVAPPPGTTRTNGLKRVVAGRYARQRTVSVAQALLKASLVPLDELDRVLPADGVILDLGCGEGILANLVAAIRPGCSVVGVDRDPAQVARARAHAADNARFVHGDLHALSGEDRDVAAVVLNDVVHHQPYGAHQRLILDVLGRLRPGGVLVLKEVDQADRADAGLTRFFDSRLYPDDALCFRSRSEWVDLFARVGAADVDVRRLRHPWPASRTLFIVRRPQTLIDPYARATTIGEDNVRASATHTVVFVTGATGFLGQHLCRNLQARDLDGKPVRLVYLARHPGRRPDGLREAVPLSGDLDDLPSLRAALRGVEVVFHLAAEVKLTKGVDIWRNNHAGTVALIRALTASDAPTRVRRLVHASSIGAVDRHPQDDCRRPLTEDVAPHPLSDYGRTKLDAERAVQASGLPHAILRVPWAYGAGMTPDTHVRFLTDGVARRRLFSRLAFPGRVSMLAAEDAAEAFRLLATHPSAVNRVFYATDGRPVSLGNLFRRYASVIGQRHRMAPVPASVSWLVRQFRRWCPLQVRALVSDVLTADASRLGALGFRPRVSQREGLAALARDVGHLPPASRTDRSLRPVSVVTGAAGGIGRALAARLDAEGHALLLVDVDEAGLRAVAEPLHARSLVLDLTSPHAADDLEACLSSYGLSLDWMVNNAGVGVRGDVAVADAARLAALVSVNCSAVVALSHLLLQHASRSGVGTLINIGSSSGFQPLPHMATYAASKSFVQSFTLGLMGEVADTPGVHVMLADPSGTSTGFQAAAGVPTHPSERLLAADTVARRIVGAADRRQPTVVVGGRGRAMAAAGRILPRTVQVRVWAYLMSRLR